MKVSGISKIAFLLSLVIVLFSCNTDELENKIADLEHENIAADSNLAGKEAVIVDFIGSMNEIQDNLSKIKEREKIITTRFDNSNGEMDENLKTQIIEDIELINNLLLENKNKMASLNSKLKKSNLKITELEKMIESMATQMQQKDAEISSLQEKLSQANEQLKVLFEEYNHRIEELGDKEDKLNTAYYCFGSAKELKEQGVITKEGGFVGLGKSVKLSDNFNKKYFTQIDVKLINEIKLMSKKAKIITNHPANSYKIEGKDGSAEKLIILDTETFWSSSKYLVLVVE